MRCVSWSPGSSISASHRASWRACDGETGDQWSKSGKIGTLMTETGFPLHLSLTGRRVVVVGGGPVAARKVAACLAAGADVLVVAPYACEQIVADAAAGLLGWQQRDYQRGDLVGAWLVVAATGDRVTDEAVEAAATTQRTFCVRADDAAAGSARSPATLRRRRPGATGGGVVGAHAERPLGGGGRLDSLVGDPIARGGNNQPGTDQVAPLVVPLLPAEQAGGRVGNDLLAGVRRDDQHVGARGQAGGHLARGHRSPADHHNAAARQGQVQGKSGLGHQGADFATLRPLIARFPVTRPPACAVTRGYRRTRCCLLYTSPSP